MLSGSASYLDSDVDMQNSLEHYTINGRYIICLAFLLTHSPDQKGLLPMQLPLLQVDVIMGESPPQSMEGDL